MELGSRSNAVSAFRSRDFRLLWGGQTVSFAGDMAFLVAIGWYVTTLTGSAGSLGLVLALESAALLTTLLIGGVIADRYPRRRLMIGSDLARAVLVGILAALDATGRLSFTAILVLVALIGLADGFFQPAFGGIVPLVVEQPFLASANSMLNVARQTAAIGGPALAALVYGTAGSTTVFALDAASFVFSAALLWRARPRRLDQEPAQGPWRDLAAGFRYVASVPWLWSGIAVTTLILMVAMAPYQTLLPRLVRSHFHLGIGAYGLIFSLQAVGMVLGSFTFAHVNPRRRRAILCFCAFAINDVFMLLLALSPWFPLAAGASLVRGFFIGTGIGLWMTMLTELVPEGYLSRVISLDVFGSFGLTPVGYLVAAGLAGLFAPQAIIATGATLGALLWLPPLVSARVRSVD
jgi:MFS family permease